METNKDRAEYLADKWLNKRIDPEEEKEFHVWYAKELHKPVSLPADFVGSEGEHRQRILDAIEKGINPPIKKLWPRIAAAASLILITCAGLFYFNLKTSQTEQQLLTKYANDISPGQVGATLTLASGKKIRLSHALNGELAQESGVTITKSSNGKLIYEIKRAKAEPGKINTLSTAIGETYQVRLPDGSLVYLNSASSLSYSVSLLDKGKRRVKLRGEGYFEVFKDKAHPFVVESGNQKVEVLGTHFNIHSYEDEKVFRTTLLEGSVKVTENGETKIIAPGFEALNTSGNIAIAKADTEWAVAWKNNKFIFDSQQIGDIMRMISRWYNVEVIYKGKVPADTFWGSVSRYNNISRVLSALESTGKVHFKIEGRRIYVSE